ncbi:MAG: STAS/SEC14 domain-containing protein [Desulfobacterales bacterium]|nr:STAS/SEC14 domain-containing protein [Desulfobacterales bacterium]
MLEFLDMNIPGVVGYRLEGKISTREMNQVLDRFREIIDRGEKIHLYQEVTSLGGLELEALVDKLRFFLDAGLSNFGRVAVVAEKKWIPRLVDFESKFVRHIDMRGFSMDEKEDALAFLRKGV